MQLFRRLCTAPHIKNIRESLERTAKPNFKIADLEGTQQENLELSYLVLTYNKHLELHNNNDWKNLEKSASWLLLKTNSPILLHAFSKTQYGDSLFHNYEMRAHKLLQNLDATNLCILVKAFTEKNKGTSKLYSEVIKRTKELLPELTPKELGFMTNTLIQARQIRKFILPDLLEKARTERLEQKELVEIIKELQGKKDFVYFVELIEKVVLESLPSYTQLEKLELFAACTSKAFSESFYTQIKECVKSGIPQSSLATLTKLMETFHSEELKGLFPSIHKRIIEVIDSKPNPKQIITILNYYKASGNQGRIVPSLEPTILKTIDQMNSYVLSRVVYNYAVFNCGSDELWEKSLEQIRKLLCKSTPYEAALMINSLSRKELLEKDLFESAQKKILEEGNITIENLFIHLKGCSHYTDSILFNELKEIFKKEHTKLDSRRKMMILKHFKAIGALDRDLTRLFRSAIKFS